jgi:uncharacterized protein YpmS
MKTWHWVLIILLVALVIGVVIYAANASKKAKEQAESQKKAQAENGDGPKSNIWTVISGISDILGESDFKIKKETA